MCGIAGIISPYPAWVQRPTLKAMADVLRHRGPDGDGFWLNPAGTVGFAHRRLSIIDLSDCAAQPMHYSNYTIAFNGEIYNYTELKSELSAAGYVFTTNSDTEVIPAAYDFWGTDCLRHFDGMFAFALYDEKQHQILLARDRFGEKPIYYHATYAQRGRFERFIFGSEMKALWAAGAPKHLNGTMVLNYLTVGYLQNPLKKTDTFYNDILSLPPGHCLIVEPLLGRVQMKKWYDFVSRESSIVSRESLIVSRESSIVNPGPGTGNLELETTEQFYQLLQTSVKRRLRSDVDIGVSLSGGIDSSSIAALCNNLKAPHLTQQCFTAAFPGFEKDEYAFSKKVAGHFNLRQHVVEVTAEDWIENFALLMHHQEEPLQSSSALAQFMVYKLAKRHDITVLLDGQGADEVLGGYKKYPQWYLQQLLRTDFAKFLREKRMLRENGFLESWGIKNYAAAFLPGKTASLLQQRAVNQQLADDNIHPDFLKKYQNPHTLQKPVVKQLEDILYHDTFKQGLQELLRYADRNSMAHSREVRLPFLNHELVEFIFGLPPNLKINNGFTKWILRQSMQHMLPAEVVWRKGKTGFEPPQQQWMAQPQAQEMIKEARKKLVTENVLKKSVLNKPVAVAHAHDGNNSDWRYLCTACLM